MEKKHPEGRTIAIERITQYLAVLVKRVEISVKNNLSNTAVSAETIMAGVLNRMYHWNLENANSEQQNFPGVDLVDEDACVAVQVTSTNSVKKVNHTLEKFTAYHLGERFNRLIVLVITNENPTDGMKLKKLEPWFVGAKDIWNIPSLLQKMMSLDVDILADIAAYLSKELGISEQPAVRIPTHRLPPVPAPSSSFVVGSRDRELAELKNMLSPDAPVFLYGVGGIGKTEVAIQLARNFAPPGGAYFLHYYDTQEEALRETILRANFTDYTYKKPDNDRRDQEYKERMDILRTEYPGALLVIDNFDCTGKAIAQLQAEPAYRELTAMGIRLVFTTRSCPEEYGYQVERLDETFLLTLMRKNLKHIDVSDEELRQLITAVDGHTLMVVLMARTLTASRGNLKASDILTALRDSRMNSRSFREVSNTHNSEYMQARIYDHMKALFKLSDMNDTEQEVLRWATLLPEDGMDAGLFQSCLKDSRFEKMPDEVPEELRELLGKLIGKIQEQGEERQDTMNSLIDRGWLALGEKNLLTIHPVIREVCRTELEPTDENCGEFLDRLWNRYSLSKEFYADKFTQIARCFSMASDKLEDKQGEFALRAGWFWDKLGQAQMALRYELRMVERREKDPATKPEDLATAYNNVGTTYCNLGNHQKALEYQLKAMKIREKVLPPEHPDLAISYGNVGTIYGDMGNHQKALEYQLKALEIHERVLPPMHPHLATSYNNVGTTYGALGDHSKALEFKLKALAIREKVLPPEHPSLATSYSNISATYGNLGDHEKELEYDLKALAIREKVLPPEHPSLATSYNNIGVTYANLEQFSRAAEYLEKALVILKKSLPEEHPYIASSEESLRYIQLMAMLQEAGISLDDLMKDSDT